jgi:DNA-binding MarR family transcriptional regulator
VQASVETKQASPEAAVSTDRLADGLTALMKHLLVTTGRDFFAKLEQSGISVTQAKALMFVIESEEPKSVKALSDLMGLSLPGVSRAIDGLVQRGELTRAEDPRDRRSKLVSVTARGRKTYERLLATRLAGVRRFVEDLTPEEQQALAHALDAVAGRIDR